ncbi:IQ domain-containing protein K [Nematostella vectensis]|uniref:IQ domain-containing protein K n=1 Tax=Nematostella vectensis TaxID=45351 RepID=UPI002077059F|nr:IQ domain-containing protein K [Nematostella vectensis]
MTTTQNGGRLSYHKHIRFYAKNSSNMYVPACSPSSSIFSEMLELNAQRYVSKRDDFDDEITREENYNAAKSSPVFVGRYGHKLTDSSGDAVMDGDDGFSTRSSFLPDFDASTTHPAAYGYVLLDKKPPVVKEATPLPNPKECSPREYLGAYIFPTLLPGLEKMLGAAKENKVFERRRTKFNACDFITEYLYRNNPRYDTRQEMTLEQIPFVQRILEENPRPPLPMSLLLSDEEASVIIQSAYRGYLTRKRPDVQELRQYQKEMRNEAVDIFLKVEDFWRKHPVDELVEDDSATAESLTEANSTLAATTEGSISN